jgi:hypothetical protein
MTGAPQRSKALVFGFKGSALFFGSFLFPSNSLVKCLVQAALG